MTNYIDAIFQQISKNNGFVTAKEVTQAGIPRRCLSELTKKGKIHKVDRGIYALPEVWEDELFFQQYRFSKGVYSNETALYLHGLTDRTPSSFAMTFPFGYNTSKVKKHGIIPITCQIEYHTFGICEVKSPLGNPLKIYDIERTLCDIVKTTHHTDIQIINQAMKAYASSKERDLAKLMDYAQRLKVKSKVLRYMEVLL
jgi:predicted transcriptional regulator of viral defense system